MQVQQKEVIIKNKKVWLNNNSKNCLKLIILDCMNFFSIKNYYIIRIFLTWVMIKRFKIIALKNWTCLWVLLKIMITVIKYVLIFIFLVNLASFLTQKIIYVLLKIINNLLQIRIKKNALLIKAIVLITM